MIDEGKYVVFRKQDMDHWSLYSDVPWPEPVHDAIVLRRQDQFTAAALWSYVHSLRTSLEILMQFGYPSKAARQHLWDLADYMADQARQAELEGKKVPD